MIGIQSHFIGNIGDRVQPGAALFETIGSSLVGVCRRPDSDDFPSCPIATSEHIGMYAPGVRKFTGIGDAFLIVFVLPVFGGIDLFDIITGPRSRALRFIVIVFQVIFPVPNAGAF